MQGVARGACGVIPVNACHGQIESIAEERGQAELQSAELTRVKLLYSHDARIATFEVTDAL